MSKARRESLNAFLDAELERLELAADRLALVGFSQGTMMSLHVGLSRAVEARRASSAIPGMLAGGSRQRLAPDAPPILLVHGDADPMIPARAMFDAAAALGSAGAAVQWHISPGVGHSIDEAGLGARRAAFLDHGVSRPCSRAAARKSAVPVALTVVFPSRRIA